METIQAFMNSLGYYDEHKFLDNINKGNIDYTLKVFMMLNDISIENLDTRHFHPTTRSLHTFQAIPYTEKLEHINIKKALLARMVSLGSSSIESLRQDENIFINKKKYIEDTGEIENGYHKDEGHDAIGYEPIFGRHVKGLKLEYINTAEALLNKQGLPNGFIYPIDIRYSLPLTNMLKEASNDHIKYMPASNYIDFDYHVFYVMSDPGSADNVNWKDTTHPTFLNCGIESFTYDVLSRNDDLYENQKLKLSIKLSNAKKKYLSKYRQRGERNLKTSGINRQNAYVFIKKRYVLDFTTI